MVAGQLHTPAVGTQVIIYYLHMYISVQRILNGHRMHAGPGYHE